MKRYIAMGILVVSSMINNVCWAAANTKNTLKQPGAISTIPVESNKNMRAYNQYLQTMQQLNADRQCANLPPQHVYSYKEYKQAY